jgi:hypothetical protein
MSVPYPRHPDKPGSNGHESLIRAELTRLCEEFALATERVWEARARERELDAAVAEEECREAAAAHWAATLSLADFTLLCLRQTVAHRKDALRLLLLDVLGLPAKGDSHDGTRR